MSSVRSNSIHPPTYTMKTVSKGERDLKNQNLSSKPPGEAWVFLCFHCMWSVVPFYGLVNFNTEEGVDSSQNNGSGGMTSTHLICILSSHMEVGPCLCPGWSQKFVIAWYNHGSEHQHANLTSVSSSRSDQLCSCEWETRSCWVELWN